MKSDKRKTSHTLISHDKLRSDDQKSHRVGQEISRDSFVVNPLTKKFFRILQDGTHSRIVLKTFANLAMVVADNSFAFWLSGSAAKEIVQYLNLTAESADAFQFCMIINSCLVVTAVDLYSSSGLVENMIAVNQTLKIMPTYRNYMIMNTMGSAAITVFAALGTAAIIFLGYDELTAAIPLASLWFLVNICTGTFYGQSLLNLFRQNYIKPSAIVHRKLSKIEKLSRTLVVYSSKDSEFMKLLKEFSTESSDDNLLKLVNCLRTYIANSQFKEEKHLLTISSTLNHRSVTMTSKACRNVTKTSYAAFITMASMYIFYGVGSQALSDVLESHDLNIPVGLPETVGVCLAAIVSVTAYFSAHTLSTTVIKGAESFFNTKKTRRMPKCEAGKLVGRALLIIMMASFHSLSMISMVAHYNKAKSYKGFIFLCVMAVFQEFNVRALALVELSPTAYMNRLYQSIAKVFSWKIKEDQFLLKEHLGQMVEQLQSATDVDINQLYDALLSLELVEQCDLPTNSEEDKHYQTMEICNL